jgi:hypothetical protein
MINIFSTCVLILNKQAHSYCCCVPQNYWQSKWLESSCKIFELSNVTEISMEIKTLGNSTRQFRFYRKSIGCNFSTLIHYVIKKQIRWQQVLWLFSSNQITSIQLSYLFKTSLHDPNWHYEAQYCILFAWSTLTVRSLILCFICIDSTKLNIMFHLHGPHWQYEA